MKIYSYDAAPNAQRLNFFLQLKGVEIEKIPVDMIAGEQLGDEYRSINPLGTVPTLVLDDGTVLTEVIGMCVYLEELYPQNPLLGTTPLEKAQIFSWDHKLFNSVMSAVAEALRNRGKGFVDRALPGPLNLPQIPELAERGKTRLEHGWPSLEAELEGKEWLVGNSLSMADLDLMICVDFSGWVKSSPSESYQNIHAHSARVKSALAQS